MSIERRVLSEEVGKVIPEVVRCEDNGVDAKSLDYARLVAVLIEAIKEQQKEIEDLKAAMISRMADKEEVEPQSIGSAGHDH